MFLTVELDELVLLDIRQPKTRLNDTLVSFTLIVAAMRVIVIKGCWKLVVSTLTHQ